MSAALDAVGLAATAGLLLGAHALAVRGCPPPPPEFLPAAPKRKPRHRAQRGHAGWEPGELTTLRAQVDADRAAIPEPTACDTCGHIPLADLAAIRLATEGT